MGHVAAELAVVGGAQGLFLAPDAGGRGVVGEGVEIVHSFVRGLVGRATLGRGIEPDVGGEGGVIDPQAGIGEPAGFHGRAFGVVEGVVEARQLLHDGIVGGEDFAGVDGVVDGPDAGLGAQVMVARHWGRIVGDPVVGAVIVHPHRCIGRAVRQGHAVAGIAAAEVGHEVCESCVGAVGVGGLAQTPRGVADPFEADQCPDHGGIFGALAADAAVGVGVGQQAIVGQIRREAAGLGAHGFDVADGVLHDGPQLQQTVVAAHQFALAHEGGERDAGFLAVEFHLGDGPVGAHPAQERVDPGKGFGRVA